MRRTGLLHLLCLVIALVSVQAEDAYKYYTWTVTYGTISPLGSPQQVILINGQFPGPRLDLVTNENVILNLINKLDEPFLLTWNGIKQRKNSWQDGVLGTNCPIPPNSNYTYKFQAKDQIGTYTYFPSTQLHKAAGGFGALNVYHRSVIPIPYPNPDGDFTLLVGDWYKTNHKTLRQTLESGKPLAFPDGLLINGQAHSTFTGNPGKTYMFRISNVGFSTSINFRIQGHTLKLVEVEGSHTVQNLYDSLDVHVGQSVAVLVTLNQPPKDYYIVASTRFTETPLTTTAVLHYANSFSSALGPVPAPPVDKYDFDWSMKQARTYRWNLTANAARPNPQGSFHYGKITPTKVIKLANSAPLINGKLRYAVNSVSYVNPDTPLKLADYFNIPGIFSVNLLQNSPSNGPGYIGTSVLQTSLHDFIEVIFHLLSPFFLCAFAFQQHTTMATNAFTGTSLSMRSVIPQTQAFASISGPTSASISSFGRKNVSFSLQPRLIRLKISCAAAKPETVEKVCKIVKKQLAMPETDVVTGESKFATLGADSLDTVEIVMALEEAFGIAIEEDSAQSIATVQDAADLIEEIVQKKSS